MYLTYWNLATHPFSSAPDPKFYFASRSGEDPASQALAGVARHKQLVLLTGVEGSGKTTCLRRVADLLPPHEYKVAFVTHPASTFPALLREIAGQLENRATAAQTLEFHAKAFYNAVAIAAREGRHIVAIVDDFSCKSPSDLAALSGLLTGHPETTKHATFLIAGTPDLKMRIEEPACMELFESHGVHCEAKGIDSRESMKSYIEHRLKSAGRPGPCPFSDDAIDAIWDIPANRTPGQLNSVCRVCLKRSAENSIKVIGADMARAVSTSLQLANTTAMPFGQIPSPNPGKLMIQSTERHSGIQNTGVDDAKARLASHLAADKIRHMESITDPFEAWNSARDEILSVLKAAPARRAAN